MKHVHFIGIGGSGLSAIALVLQESGHCVSGSDRQASPFTQRLQEAGVQVFIGHRAENVLDADLVVRSSAVTDDNVEVQAARAAEILVLKRADFLGQLISDKKSIAVAGTHGKTTTTAMIAWILSALGCDPSYIIGGVSVNLHGNAHAGRGDFFVIEADEYDRMFLGLRPQIAVVTHVEHDHPDCYPTYQDFYAAFQEFVGRVQAGGALVVCGDDPGASSLPAQVAGSLRSVSYSTHQAQSDYFADNLVPGPQGGFSFSVQYSGGKVLEGVSLQVPGEHNVRNALAALAVADLLGLPLKEAANALGEFRGTGRRFEVRGEMEIVPSQPAVTVIDDYAHHPTEIRATLAAARTRYPGQRIWAVWQPHTYSRTRTLFADFVTAFADADCVLVTEVYAARECPPPDGFSACRIVEAMVAEEEHPNTVNFAPDLANARDFLLEHLQPGDVVLVLSAGDADQISTQLVRREKHAR